MVSLETAAAAGRLAAEAPDEGVDEGREGSLAAELYERAVSLACSLTVGALALTSVERDGAIVELVQAQMEPLLVSATRLASGSSVPSQGMEVQDVLLHHILDTEVFGGRPRVAMRVVRAAQMLAPSQGHHVDDTAITHLVSAARGSADVAVVASMLAWLVSLARARRCRGLDDSAIVSSVADLGISMLHDAGRWDLYRLARQAAIQAVHPVAARLFDHLGALGVVSEGKLLWLQGLAKFTGAEASLTSGDGPRGLRAALGAMAEGLLLLTGSETPRHSTAFQREYAQLRIEMVEAFAACLEPGHFVSATDRLRATRVRAARAKLTGVAEKVRRCSGRAWPKARCILSGRFRSTALPLATPVSQRRPHR